MKTQKSYKDWNFSWPENSWEISEPAIYYQGAYIALLSRIIDAGSGCSPATSLEDVARLDTDADCAAAEPGCLYTGI